MSALSSGGEMSDLASKDPVRALRGAVSRVRRAVRLVAGDSAHFPGIEHDLTIAERAIGVIECGCEETGEDEPDRGL